MMNPSDDRLLDFESERLADYSEGRAREWLVKHPDLYRNHLVIAHWIDGWIERMRVDRDPDEGDEFETALREVAAHLRQGDFLPGEGDLYEDEVLRLARDGRR